MSVQVGYYEAWRDLMRSWGHRVIEINGWQQRDAEPRTPYSPGRMYVEHHDASSLLSGNWGALAYITRANLANIVTARDGQLALNAAGVQWHAGVGGPRWEIGRNMGNPNSMGNEVCNSGREGYSPECTAAVVDSEVAWALVSGRAAELHRILGHKDWATPAGRKVDPSLHMDVRRQQVANRLAEVQGAVPVRPAPVPAPAPAPPPPAPPVIPAMPPPFRWALPRGHYYGHKNGPARSHGGYHPAERDEVQWIQRKWIALGLVAGQRDWRSPWADGIWDDASTAVCRIFFARFRPSQPIHTQIWSDDYAHLARL